MWKYEKSDNLYFRKLKKSKNDTALLFLHGLSGSRNYWGNKYDSLSEAYTLYFVDLLGFGFSKKPNVEYTVSLQVDALHIFIDERVTEKRIVFVGHSLGAIIALGYTAAYPQSITKTYLVSLPYYHNEQEAKTYLTSHVSYSFLYTDTFTAHLSCHFVCMFRPFFLFFAPLLAGKKSPMLVRDAFLHTHSSYFSSLGNIIFHQNIRRLLKKEVTRKLTLVHGENDSIAPVGNIKELSEQFELNSIILQKKGHDFPYAHSEELLKIITSSGE